MIGTVGGTRVDLTQFQDPPRSCIEGKLCLIVYTLQDVFSRNDPCVAYIVYVNQYLIMVETKPSHISVEPRFKRLDFEDLPNLEQQ